MKTTHFNSFTRTGNVWAVLVLAVGAWLATSVWAFRIAAPGDAQGQSRLANEAQGGYDGPRPSLLGTDEPMNTEEDKVVTVETVTTPDPERVAIRENLQVAQLEQTRLSGVDAKSRDEQEFDVFQKQIDAAERLLGQVNTVYPGVAESAQQDLQAGEDRLKMAALEGQEQPVGQALVEQIAAQQVLVDQAAIEQAAAELAAAEQAAAEQAAAEQAAAEQAAAELAAAELAAAEQVAVELAAAEQVAAEQAAAEQVAAEQAAAEQAAAEQAAAEQAAAEQAAKEAERVARVASSRQSNSDELDEQVEDVLLASNQQSEAGIDAAAEDNTANVSRTSADSQNLTAEQRLQLEELSVLTGLSARARFETRSEIVDRELEKTLDRMFDPLFLYSEVPVLITVSSNEFRALADNNRLSNERGESVVEYLVSLGLEPDRFRVEAISDEGLQYGTHRLKVSVEDLNQ